MEIKHQPFGEIIESSLTHWRGQCWQWDYFPPFGSLITIHAGDTQLLGIIYDVNTGSADPSREAYAFQKTEEELKREQPQLFAFLKTTFSCIPVGSQEGMALWHQLPATPPKIHAFIAHAPRELLEQYFATTHYLHMLMNAPAAQPYRDELLLNVMRQLTQHKLLTPVHSAQALETYSLMPGNDYRTLKRFAARLQQITPFTE